MSTDNNTGKKTIIFAAAATAVFLLVVAVRLMAGNGIRSGNYNNPNVASSVVDGNIYDRNGKLLSLTSNGSRNYPYSSHALSTILKVEKALEKYIEPHPGYNEATTFGCDIYLTLDADIQYILDSSIENLKNYQSFNEVFGLITDATTGEILAIHNNSFIPVLDSTNLSLIKTITDHKGKEVDYDEDISVFFESREQLENLSSTVRCVDNRYNIMIVSDSESRSGISQVEEEIIRGLKSQTKL